MSRPVLRPTRAIPRRLFLGALVVAMVAAACGSGAGSPGATPGASVPPIGGPVTTPEQAIAAVVAHEPRLAGIGPRDPNAIGQAHWYEALPASGVGAFVVSVRVGWGDCPAGCISEHTWVYAVGPNGEVRLQSEGGEPVPANEWPSPGAGGSGQEGGLLGPGTGLWITALAGPTCPVERPGDDACAPKPVPGAVILVTDGRGESVAKAELDATGSAFVELPAGSYLVEAAPVAGLMGAPGSQAVTVADGARSPVVFTYDTGIR
jgi:hypothetical protein